MRLCENNAIQSTASDKQGAWRQWTHLTLRLWMPDQPLLAPISQDELSRPEWLGHLKTQEPFTVASYKILSLQPQPAQLITNTDAAGPE